MDRSLLTAAFFALTALGGVSAITGCEPPTLEARERRPSGKNTLNEDCADLPAGALTDDGSRCPGGSDDKESEADAGTEKADGGGFARSPGVTTCQPAFEKACKPPIIFTNGDPTNRGKAFTDAIPNVVAAEQEIACIACSILYRTPDEIPANKFPKQIKLVLDTHGGVAQAGGEQIQFDLDYIANFAKGHTAAEVKQEMLGVLQHETVHLYQNYGTGGTGEGLADLVRARTGYYSQDRWKGGQGSWKDPYTTSGNFYSWLTGPCSYHSTYYSESNPDFPYLLNKALGGTNDSTAHNAAANLIQATFDRTPEDLWAEYQRTAFPDQATAR